MRVFTRILRFFRPPPGGGRPPAAFGELAAAYTERARMWLILLGAGRADAEDIVQDALLALWERRDQVPPAARPRWLQQAISLRIREHRRSRSAMGRHEARAWEAATGSGRAWAPEDALARAEVAASVRRLVDGLPPELRAVVLHYFLEEQSMEEVAERLGVGVRTAWSRWWRAKGELRAVVVRARQRERFRAGAVSFGMSM